MFWERFFVKPLCRVGFGLRDCEPVWTETDLWLRSRDPQEIFAIVKFATRNRLPVMSWLANVDAPDSGDVRLLVEIAGQGTALVICAPQRQHAQILAAMHATRRLDPRARVNLLSSPLPTTPSSETSGQ